MTHTRLASVSGRTVRGFTVLVAVMCFLSLLSASTASTASAATPAETWSSPSLVSASFSSEYFSCASSTLCIDVGEGGSGIEQYSVFNGTAWSTPAATSTIDPSAITTLSCAPGTTFCMAGDAAGNSLTYTGTWSSPIQAAPSQADHTGILALSCPTTSFCMALATEDAGAFYVSFTYDGTGWSPPASTSPELDQALNGLSCASATLCVAIGDGVAAPYDGTSWQDSHELVSFSDVGDGQALTGVSCAPGTTTCVAVDNAGTAYGYAGSAITGQNIDSAGLTSISCVAGVGSDVDCVTLDSDGDALSTTAPTTAESWNSGVADALEGVAPIVSCVSTTDCAAVDDIAFSSASAGPTATSWTAGPLLGSGGFTAVSCVPDIADCVAVDATGHAVVLTNSAASAPVEIDNDTTLISIACPSASVCFAGDVSGNLLTINPSGGTPGVTSLASGTAITAISCASASFCVALSSNGGAFTYNGSGWSAPTAIDSAANELDAVSCASASFCIATDAAGNAFGYIGSTWSGADAIDGSSGELDAVSCPVAGYCMAGDATGGIITLSDGAWSKRVTPVQGGVLSVACTSSVLCQIATTGGLETEISGGYYPLSSDDFVDAVSCSDNTYCRAVDENGNTLSFSGPPSNTGAPTISGSVTQGATLTVSTGTWLGSPSSYSYQWLVCQLGATCTAIAGATSASYTIPLVQVNESFMATVTANNANGSSEPVATTRTGIIGPLAPTNTVAPRITGTAAVGKTLTAATGTWSGVGPITYTYQWYLCGKTCAAVKGATQATYAVTTTAIGTTITVAVTATTSYGATVVASPLTSVITAPAATLKSWVAPLLSLSGTPGHLTKIKSAKGYTAIFRAAIPGTVKVAWTIIEKIAHTKRTKTVTLASVTAKTTVPATKLKVKLNATGVKLLRTLKREKVTATATFTYAYGTSTRSYKATRVLTLAH